MPENIIKIKQIDNAQLISFLESNLGLSLGAASASHSFSETFTNGIVVQAGASIAGTATFSSQPTFSAGLLSNGNAYINGIISGQSVIFDSFNITSGKSNALSVGNINLTGIPIYESGQASTAVLLPSGTVFGIKQVINAPLFDKDSNGDLTPSTEVGVQVVTLCVSIGS